MMTIEKSIVDSAKMIDLISLAGQYTELSRASGTKEWQGACPKCGGDDRFHVKTGGFFCRQCKSMESNNGIWYDQIDFVRWMDGCDFASAVNKLVGRLPLATNAAPQTAQKAIQHEHHTGWVDKASAIVESAHAALMAGGAGFDYLAGRGISQAAMQTFNLGFAPAVSLPGTWDDKKRIHTQPKHPAIVIPWLRRGKVTGIRYRFLTTHVYVDLSGKERTTKQSAVYDSDFTGLFGGQAVLGCAEGQRTLVICEGELNAISIWQITKNWNFDVLSLGSESGKITQPMLDYAKRFGRLLIWLDREDLVERMMTIMPESFGIHARVVDGRKQDANNLLQAGTLGVMMAEARYRACRSDTERLALLWNIQDGVAQGDFDLGACEVALTIAKDMGVKL
jgi:hypothetical protein